MCVSKKIERRKRMGGGGGGGEKENTGVEMKLYCTWEAYIHTYNTYISSIHDITLGAFGYETLSDKRY